MNGRIFRLLGAGAAFAVVVALSISYQAHSQIDVSPDWVPVGVSQSGGSSTAWFHEPGSRQAVACQTVAKQGSERSSIQCVSTRLPSP